jgi:hypothetical protein
VSQDPRRSVTPSTILREALDGATDLPGSSVTLIRELIDVGELKVALEILCTQIYEYDLELGPTEREKLCWLGQRLGVPSPYLLGDPWAEPGTTP